MGLLDKLLGGKKKEREDAPPSSLPATSQFQESQVAGSNPSPNAPHRDLLQVVLRETMRQHGIPSDWMDCRILSVVRRNNTRGMHVQFIVKQGHDALVSYVYAFQDSFMRELEKFEPQASEWLMSLAWQFQGRGSTAPAMPDPATWGAAEAAVAPSAAPQAEPKVEEDDVEEDLKALFAIRDAALQGQVHADEPPDFQPTQPGFIDSGKGR